MRALLLNTSEQTGGAAIAAHRIMQALNKNGVQARMLVRDATGTDEHVVRLAPSPSLRAKFIMERAAIWAGNKFSRRHLFEIDPATHGTDVTPYDAFRRADVVHLHWVNQAFLSMEGLRRIFGSGKPLVWTLHDMWPFTGICHYSRQCDGWLWGCGRCRLLARPRSTDLSRRTFQAKQRLFARTRVHIVACSDWLAGLARRSPVLEGQPVWSIPNPIDTDFFSPSSRETARRRLGLPVEKRLLLFAAYQVADPLKGVTYLAEAVEHLVAERPDLHDRLGIIVAGRGAEAWRDRFAVPAYPQGYVQGAAAMRELYRAADVLAMPSMADNLPNTIVEAMACGVPCAGFDVGGLPQLISHGRDGYLARFCDADDLARGIGSTLLSPALDALRRAAREKAVHNYSETAVARQYARVYEQAIEETSSRLNDRNRTAAENNGSHRDL